MADNATIVIGAKDQASQILQQVAKNTEQLTNTVNKMALAAKAATAVLLPIAALTAGIRVVQGLVSASDSAVEAYNTQARAARGMSQATLDVTAQWQKSLGVGDEVSLQLIRQAQMLGMTEEQATQAAKATLGLSQATGKGHLESLRQVHAAMQNGTDITEVATNGLREMQTQMNSLEGVQTRASNSMGDLMESIGNILAPMRMLIAQGFAVAAEVLQDVLKPAVDAANQALGSMGPILDWITKQVVTAITVIEVGLRNLPQVFEYIKLSAELFFVSFMENMKHAFTSQGPALLEWFGRNWLNILSDTFQAIVVMQQNRFKQMWDLFKLGFQMLLDVSEWFGDAITQAITSFGPKVLQFLSDTLQAIGKAFTTTWDWITSWFTSGTDSAMTGLTASLKKITDNVVEFVSQPPQSLSQYASQFGEIMSRNLLEGFEATTEPLPDLIQRQLTDREKQLKNQMAGIGDDLGSQFQTAFDRRMEMVTQGFKETVDGLGKIEGNLPNLAAGGAGGSGLQAVESRLLTRGSGEDPAKIIQKNTEQMVKAQQEANAKLERLARRAERQRDDSLRVQVVQ